MNLSNPITLGATKTQFVDGDRSARYPKREEYVHSGILFLNGESINGGVIDKSATNFISDQKYNEIKKGRIARNDILLTTRGNSVGDAAFVNIDDKGLINAQMLILRVDSREISPKFLFYYLTTRTLRGYISNFASGSAQPQIPIRDLRKIPIYLPDLDTQKKIAAILSAYDDLIENNQRRIALLEKMTEEIYREWFVRLRFPGREKVKKIKGRPERWEIDRVDSIGKVVTGKTPSTINSRYFGGPYLFIKTPDMHGNIFVYETEEVLSQDGLDSQSSQTIPEGSICVSCIGTGGIVSISTSKCQTNQQINSVVLRDQSDLEWAFFTLRNLRETIQMFGSTGTTMTNLSKGKFSSLKILRPDKNIVRDYHALVKPMFVQMQSILQRTRILIRSRELLLPRLISGKLSVENLDIHFPPSMEEAVHET